MAIRYTDSSISAAQSAANSGLSALAPKRLPSDHTLSSGDEVWIKGGGPDYVMPATPIPCQWSSVLNGVVRGWPGTPKPILRHPDVGSLATQARVIAPGSGGNWTIENLIFRDCGGACVTMNTGSGTGVLTIRGIEVYNCGTVFYASASGYLTNIGAGGSSALAEVYLFDSIFDGAGSDQCWFRAATKAEMARNTFRNASTLDALGDNLQIFESCSDLWVHHNLFDHRNADSKQCFIQSLGFLGVTRFEDNTVFGWEGEVSAQHNAVYSDQLLLCRRNFVSSASSAIYYGTNGTVIEGNIVRAGGGRANTGTIWGATITDLQVRHNLVYKGLPGADVGEAAIRSTTSSANISVRNNIIAGFSRGVRRGAASVESTNLFWNVTTPVVDSGGSTPLASGVGSFLADPLLVDPSRPWLGLRPDSPAWNAGAFIQGAKDRYGRMYTVPSHIGPWAVK